MKNTVTPRDYYVQIRILNKDGLQDVNIPIKAVNFTRATNIAREICITKPEIIQSLQTRIDIMRNLLNTAE